MIGKRSSENYLSELLKKKASEDLRKNDTFAHYNSKKSLSPFLSHPVNPEKAISIFLTQARTTLRKDLSMGTNFPITKPLAEIETRIGTLKSSYLGPRDMRVLSSGPKRLQYKGEICVANAFICSSLPHIDPSESSLQHHHKVKPRYQFENGVTRSHFTKWTCSGISESGRISKAFGIRENDIDSITLSKELVETDISEIIFGGYAQEDKRLCVTGNATYGQMENKSKLNVMDLSLPSAPYDIRLTLSSERIIDAKVSVNPLPSGWTHKRTKRRRSYTRRDKSFAWRLDVTETMTVESKNGLSFSSELSSGKVQYEIELELESSHVLRLVNETDNIKVKKLIAELAQQLWWMLLQINPSSEVLDAKDFLINHPDTKEVSLAMAHCAALKSYSDNYSRGNKNTKWSPAIVRRGEKYIDNNNTLIEIRQIEKNLHSTKKLENLRFAGCMPVNFSRHHIVEVQRTSVDRNNCGYFLSEKTDGIRHLLVFTGKTAVLIDRTMTGKQPRVTLPGFRSLENGEYIDPMSRVLPLIRPGTVLDGEVVVHRRLRRPVFIVFDVLCVSSMQPIIHLPFAQRMKYMQRESFRQENTKVEIFSDTSALVLNDSDAMLPLVRKVFVRRSALDDILSHIVEEQGMRFYRHGNGVYDHLTDGIIFQPNTPYVCGTDINLLKWKYLDTVTIDVELIDSFPSKYHNRNNDFVDNQEVKNNYSTPRFGVLGDEGSIIDMTRHIRLHPKECLRLEADQNAMNYKSRIVEIGFDPSMGEWFYGTIRPDKLQPNHVSTVMASILELAERLDLEELRYRMMIDGQMGIRDLYQRDIRKMKAQLLDYQRRKFIMKTRE